MPAAFGSPCITVSEFPGKSAASRLRPDLGRAGVFAVMTPAENPTAEPELSVLMGPDVNLLTTRMHVLDADMDVRLIGYARGMDRWMQPFAGAALDGALFACTGSSYLTPRHDAPGRVIAQAGGNLPLVAAATAVHDALQALNARRLVIVSPYPNTLTLAATAWWRGMGYQIQAVLDVPPTAQGHPIYARDARAILATLRRARTETGDVVVALGTGAPSLPALALASLETERPMLSSNLCTAWAASRLLTPPQAEPPHAWLAPDAPWRARLASRFPRLMSRLDD
jgi:maleate isomerase